MPQKYGSGGILAKSQEFTATGTWTKPGNVQWVDVILVGGGGGSGGSAADNQCAGGGGGGEVVHRIIRVTANVVVTIGGGGAAGAAGDNTGVNGTASTLATGCTLSASGGTGEKRAH